MQYEFYKRHPIDKPLLDISIPGYIFLHVNTSTNAGGVGIYIIDTLQYEEIMLRHIRNCCFCVL